MTGAVRTTTDTPLRRAVRQVVDNGNCSGCGACTFLDPGLEMRLGEEGFVRPVSVADGPDGRAIRGRFKETCPGVRVRAPRASGRRVHPVLGPYVEVYVGWAKDPDIQRRGSSGGVLTALAAWLVETGRMPATTVARRSVDPPTGTVITVATSAAEVRGSAGSRYAPASALGGIPGRRLLPMIVAKPCEADAARRLAGEAPPLLLSFFCAGVPSQRATDSLVRLLGADPASVTELAYRGDGWPGEFRVADGVGRGGRLSYDESWGAHLGRALQDRCRICPDGTGEHADVAVGDFWQADEHGYPVFADGEGRSAVIARTPRGAAVLLEAQAAGVIVLEPATPDAVAGIQPFQRLRRTTLLGRLVGRRLAGRAVPRITGYGLVGRALRSPRRALEFARGSYHRARH
ncbi:Coenzyme F420 hydrogenase/dehydrogenase, beta subunit C-terminal domain [Pseudonocardia sp. WMMC193]|uniref:Coenzyme F420 hydrogenase/dehydrogenase, beta subunit C-terminal domain n=1 Tax=Pseudonocardia sp. WMMC193 TaxID=2911965 RepID=UPI001F26A2F0|nr:Coenzyme F420 hydrogenase/dehydrogenase, beta subunit C-terminal domain [Pseudonocardia sp. WMMC193]MCF7553842.1 Coenzyme F420 hydrogenase/dehydrogenase, beta subunit C-terminal domain [Pseudonocardia sp. WMMC193]